MLIDSAAEPVGTLSPLTQRHTLVLITAVPSIIRIIHWYNAADCSWMKRQEDPDKGKSMNEYYESEFRMLQAKVKNRAASVLLCNTQIIWWRDALINLLRDVVVSPQWGPGQIRCSCPGATSVVCSLNLWQHGRLKYSSFWYTDSLRTVSLGPVWQIYICRFSGIMKMAHF